MCVCVCVCVCVSYLVLTILTAYCVPVARSVQQRQVEKLPAPNTCSPREYFWRKREFYNERSKRNVRTFAIV